MQLNKFLPLYGLALLLTLFALYLIKEFNLSYPINLTTTSRSSELAVVGEGKVDIVPDTAMVEVGISVNNSSTVESAQNTINETNNKIIEAMNKLGIDKKDIKTSNYSVNPNYNYDRGPSSLSGYNGNVTVSIKVKKTGILSQVVQEATKAGANQINGTRFVIENPEKYREEARNKAIENAKEQANKLAGSLGIKLGKIVNIVESAPGNSNPYLMLKSAAPVGLGGTDSTANIEPGTQTVTSTVTLYFEKL